MQNSLETKNKSCLLDNFCVVHSVITDATVQPTIIRTHRPAGWVKHIIRHILVVFVGGRRQIGVFAAYLWLSNCVFLVWRTNLQYFWCNLCSPADFTELIWNWFVWKLWVINPLIKIKGSSLWQMIFLQYYPKDLSTLHLNLFCYSLVFLRWNN